MWITGMFVWIEQVQENELYSEMLDMFVSGGMSPEDRLLIDVVSDILDGGRNKDERYENFQSALEAVGLTSS